MVLNALNSPKEARRPAANSACSYVRKLSCHLPWKIICFAFALLSFARIDLRTAQLLLFCPSILPRERFLFQPHRPVNLTVCRR